MAISSANAGAAPKVRKVETLTSGTSWTVPTGVEFVNATLIGGGGGGSKPDNVTGALGRDGQAGQVITTTVATTPGASITYAIGAGGAQQSTSNSAGNAGGNTTFTGATTATGGAGAGIKAGAVGANYLSAGNQGQGGFESGVGGAGGSGCIILEYWV